MGPTHKGQAFAVPQVRRVPTWQTVSAVVSRVSHTLRATMQLIPDGGDWPAGDSHAAAQILAVGGVALY